jgi:small subunit ribosomal protein S6
VAVQNYECLFLLDPNKATSDLDGSIRALTSIIEREGGSIEFSQPWGESKLAYPIKKFRKGVYVLTYFKIDSLKLKKVEAELAMVEHLIRFMPIKLHPMIAQQALAHLRGEAPAPGRPEHQENEVAMR